MSIAKLANSDVRGEMKTARVTLWQIADTLNVCEMTVTRKFRREMSSEEKSEMLTLIKQIAEQNKGA
jgi:IS30 family transposase